MAITDDGIDSDESASLIASNKIEGTAVYDEDGCKLGSISNFMVDKVSGHVEYAVLQFGGMFGVGSRLLSATVEKATL